MTTPALESRFLALLNEHRKILYKVASTYARDAESRRDLEQEITIQLWRSFERYDERLRFATWMYRVSLNVAISSYRSESRRLRHIVPADESILEVAADLQSTVDEDRHFKLLHEFIDRLDALDRSLMVLYLDEHSHAEIADILGISESNVGTKIGRIKQRLRRDFARAENQR